ncbi:MAG TPA: ABC transporter ATP-binding protein [Flavobacteriales bacterium]|nr:ABC transporter ATP-binding protein [Flavobacteriales bacterium]
MLIELENISKNYGNLKVLDQVSLKLEKAEIVAIVGASGAGKSTLLNILGTLDRPDSGKYFFNETDVFKFNTSDLSRWRNLKIGFIFQFHHLLNEFTALENVCIPGYIAKKSHAEVTARAKELLEMLGLHDKMENKPKQLSGGEQQRVAVARALINNPDIVLADEPSGNLDSTNAKELHKLFFKLRDEFKQTFVIVTHNEELAGMADRKLVIKDGKII